MMIFMIPLFHRTFGGKGKQEKKKLVSGRRLRQTPCGSQICSVIVEPTCTVFTDIRRG